MASFFDSLFPVRRDQRGLLDLPELERSHGGLSSSFFTGQGRGAIMEPSLQEKLSGGMDMNDLPPDARIMDDGAILDKNWNPYPITRRPNVLPFTRNGATGAPEFALPTITDVETGAPAAIGARALKGTAHAVPEGAFGVFIGRKGAANLGKLPELEIARKLYDQGVPIDDIRRETGWGFGPLGEHDWQYEISDHNMKFKPGAFREDGWGGFIPSLPSTPPLGSMVEHPELFQAIPGLDRMKVWAEHGPNTQPGGQFDTTGNSILATGMDEREVREILAHELQHGADSFEGKPGGSSPEWTRQEMELGLRELAPRAAEAYRALPESEKRKMAHRRYRHDAGEVNAEITRTRLDLDEAQRRARPPAADLPRDINPDWITLGRASAGYR